MNSRKESVRASAINALIALGEKQENQGFRREGADGMPLWGQPHLPNIKKMGYASRIRIEGDYVII